MGDSKYKYEDPEWPYTGSRFNVAKILVALGYVAFIGSFIVAAATVIVYGILD